MNMKKTLGILAVLAVLMVVCVGASAADVPTETRADSGNWTFDWYWNHETVNPGMDDEYKIYHITSETDFAAFAAIVNGEAFDVEREEQISSDSFFDAVVYLDSDLNLESKAWKPIGNYYSSVELYSSTGSFLGYDKGNGYFMGVFDGQNHLITWRMDEETAYYDETALFGLVYGGTVRNVHVNVESRFESPSPANAFDMPSGYESDHRESRGYCAGLVIYAYYATIENIVVDGSFLNNNWDGQCAGVICMAFTDCEINGCINNADIHLGQYFRKASSDQYALAGGIICQSSASYDAGIIIRNCINHGDIFIENSFDNAQMTGTGYGGALQYDSGTLVYTKKLNAAGMIGQLSGGKAYAVYIENSFSDGIITGGHIEKFKVVGENAEKHIEWVETVQKGSFIGNEWDHNTWVDEGKTKTYTIKTADKSNSAFYPNDIITITQEYIPASELQTQGIISISSNQAYAKSGCYYRPSGYGSGSIQIKENDVLRNATDDEIEYLKKVKQLVGPTVYGTVVESNLQRMPAFEIALDPNDGTLTSSDYVWDSERYYVGSYIYLDGKVLPQASDIVREGYIFGGWYDNKEYTGDSVTTISASDEGRKVFYARWYEHIEEIVPGIQPTCTETGLTEGKRCSLCGMTLVEQEIIPATGHTVIKVPGTQATCLDDGLTDGEKCEVCDAVIVKQSVIKATGHRPADPVRENEVKPTEQSEGSYDEVVYCSECTAELTRNHIVVPKIVPATVWHVTYYPGAADAGSVPVDAGLYAHNSEVTVANKYTLSRTGYTFGGWKDRDNHIYQPGASFTIKEDTDLFAQWNPITYSIKFDANGGTESPADIPQVRYDEEKELSTADGMENIGYKFGGWAVTPDTGAKYADGDTVKNLTANDGEIVTLYAVWNKVEKLKVVETVQDETGDATTITKTTDENITTSTNQADIKKETDDEKIHVHVEYSENPTVDEDAGSVTGAIDTFNLSYTKKIELAPADTQKETQKSVAEISYEMNDLGKEEIYLLKDSPELTAGANAAVMQNLSPSYKIGGVLEGTVDDDINTKLKEVGITVRFTLNKTWVEDRYGTNLDTIKEKIKAVHVGSDSVISIDYSLITDTNSYIVEFVSYKGFSSYAVLADPVYYTVFYQLNGGHWDAPNEKSILEDTAIPSNEWRIPTKEGDAFVDWCTDADLRNVYDKTAPVTQPMILYAKWETGVTPQPSGFESGSGSSITVFRGTAATYDGTILFDRSVVVTAAELPGASSASVTPISTKDDGWYTFKLGADGFAGNGTVWFQVPLDVIAIKDMTEKDVSLFDCDTFYLSKDGRYAYYKASVAEAGTYTIGFEAGAAQTEEPTPIAPAEQVVEPIAPVTPQPAATPAPVLGVLAGLGAAAVFFKARRQ